MTVLHVYSGNLFGGIESILATIARSKHAAAGDHQFALCFEGRLSTELRAAGAAVHHLTPVTLRKPHTLARARRALRAVLDSRGFERVICHAPWSQGLFGSVVRRAGCSLVFWAHDLMTGRHWTERLARRAAPDLVICNSRFTQRSLDVLYPGIPSAVLYAPVAMPSPSTAAGRQHVRASLDTGPDDVVIVQACRSEEWKGHELLLDALIEMRMVPNWTWWQVGGAQRPREQAFLARLRGRARRAGVADRIRWVGERTDTRDILAAADIYCQPNLEPEPFGISFIEALAARLPVVTTRQGAAEEIVDESCGALVQPGDVGQLATVLRDLVSDERGRKRLGTTGPARAQRLCDPSTQLDLLAAMLTGRAAISVPA